MRSARTATTCCRSCWATGSSRGWISKADRAVSTLRVQAAHAETGVAKAAIVEPLVAELRLMAAWLGLERIKVERAGDLARVLAGVLRG